MALLLGVARYAFSLTTIICVSLSLYVYIHIHTYTLTHTCPLCLFVYLSAWECFCSPAPHTYERRVRETGETSERQTETHSMTYACMQMLEMPTHHSSIQPSTWASIFTYIFPSISARILQVLSMHECRELNTHILSMRRLNVELGIRLSRSLFLSIQLYISMWVCVCVCTHMTSQLISLSICF